jgi:predicted ATP-grasp superfamily ATP-dependent carboligase
MKIFVYEHITGGGCLGEPLPAALRAEGELMLRSVVSGLAAIPQVEVVTMCDGRVDLGDLPAERHVVRDPGERRRLFDRLLARSDALWPVAPETGGTLERLSRAALAAGRVLLSSRPEAVRVAASKRRTAEALAAAGVEIIPTFRPSEPPPWAGGQWVAKPDDGCGCQDTRLFDDFASASDWVGAQADPGNYVVQPYVRGEAASLCVLARQGEACLLSVNRQRVVVRDGGFVFLGSVVNDLADAGGRCARLAARVARALPGLWGYFGIDIILGERGPTVAEINPRLTTSYAGLAAALECNPAAWVLGLLERGLPLAPPPHARKVDIDLRYIHGHA